MKSSLTKNKYKLIFTKDYQELSPEITKCNHPGLSLGTIPIYHGNSKINKPSGDLSFNPLVVEFEVNKDMSIYKKIANWIIDLADPIKNTSTEFYEHATLQIYTPDGVTLRNEIQFSSLFPVEITDIYFESYSEEEIEVASITFSYDIYKFL